VDGRAERLVVKTRRPCEGDDGWSVYFNELDHPPKPQSAEAAETAESAEKKLAEGTVHRLPDAAVPPASQLVVTAVTARIPHPPDTANGVLR